VKKVLLATVSLAAIGTAAPAFAADLPARTTYTKAPAIVAPIYDWTGFYVGINAGGASSHECFTLTSVAGAAIANAPSEGCHNATGGLVGGQVGYRWQSANWVLGVEAQGDWANLKGSNSSLTAIIPYTNQTKIDAIGLFTGQVGYAWNNVLVYLKGGAAVTDNKYSSFFPVGNVFAAAGVPFNAASDTRWGGVVGAGIEFGRIRPPVHGQPECDVPANEHRRRAQRQHSAGYRHGYGPRELSLRRPGHRKILITASRISNLEKAGLAPAFLVAITRCYCLLLPSRAGSATNR
jgi:outer membrane immunogenic protein